MQLSNEGIKNAKEEWISKGYRLPKFDRDAVINTTIEAPMWVHFGAGNIFRAFHAALCQDLLDSGQTDRGVIAVDGFDYEIIEKMYRPHDNLSILATLKADGTVEKSVIGSIAESVILDSEDEKEFGRMKEIFASPKLQLATFTITEKGYSLVNAKGEELPAVTSDFASGPERPSSYIGKVTALLYERYKAGSLPIAMVSTDNCSHNGERLSTSILAYAKAWEKAGLTDRGFTDYVKDEKKVSFPWTVIDKITPRPDASVEKILADDGVEQLDPVVTSRKTWVAPFVNSEETQYLVIEDWFPNGRPPLEKAGVIFTDRSTVDKVEKMKVCTCLNPLHTSLAIFGCLLGYTKMSEEMKDPDLKGLVEIVGYKEGLPVVVNPGILDPKEFIDTVVNIRVPNPFMPDTPQRIVTDTSQKLSIRFGETIKAYEEEPGRSAADLNLIPLVFAGWLRYLMAINDAGEKFELSPDPLLSEVRPYVEGIKLGDSINPEEKLHGILSNAEIFGVDLYQVGLAERVKSYFIRLIEGKGAVRRTLHSAVEAAY